MSLLRKTMILSAAFFIIRCCAGCCKELGYKFHWTEMRISNINQPPATDVALGKDSARIDSFAFRMNIAAEKVAKQSFNELGFGSAYAFKCEPLYGNTDSIVSFGIITRNALDAAHPANSLINNVVEGRHSYDFYTSYEPWYALDYVLKDMNTKSGNRIQGSFDFRIHHVTPFMGQHRFVIRAILQNGTVLTDSTNIKFY